MLYKSYCRVMKSLSLFLIGMVLCGICASQAATAQGSVSGRVVDGQGAPIAYATVILVQHEDQVCGTTTDADGQFRLQAPSGRIYKLNIQYVGYETHEQEVVLTATDLDLGDVLLREQATEIEGVVVRAQAVRREADRFVMEVAHAPVAIGHSGLEVLRNAPGVWLQQDQLTINGKSGVKIYVNDRELRLSGTQLLNYLNSLRAEDILRIEVIPISGADTDADNTAGVLRLTLRRQRADGVTGNVQLGMRWGEYTNAYAPSGSIQYHTGAWTLGADAWGTWNPGLSFETTEQTAFYGADNDAMTAASHSNGWNNYGGGRLSGVREFGDGHSLGLELQYWTDRQSSPTESQTDMQDPQNGVVHQASDYAQFTLNRAWSAVFNYKWQIDTLGSNLKLLVDYTGTKVGNDNDYQTRIATAGTVAARDSLYRNTLSSNYDIAAVTLAWEHFFSPTLSLRTGAKYTYDHMKSRALYEYAKQDDTWNPLPDYSFNIRYREHISALYAVVSGRSGRWSYVGGLRLEHTYASGNAAYPTQNYLSLFPNANLSFNLTTDGAYTVVAQYARTITRPSFWSLTPARVQVSDYTYQMGNPLLQPAFSHTIGLSFVLAHQYTLSLEADLQTHSINQSFVQEPDEPNTIYFTSENYASLSRYSVSAYLPYQPAEWCSLSANLLYSYYGNRLTHDAPQTFHSQWGVGLNSTFTLPGHWYVDLTYYGHGRIFFSNTEMASQHIVNASLKKQLWNERFTVAFAVNNIFNAHQIHRVRTDTFVRRMSVFQGWDSRQFALTLTYNFKSGRGFRQRAVESGAEEAKARL